MKFSLRRYAALLSTLGLCTAGLLFTAGCESKPKPAGSAGGSVGSSSSGAASTAAVSTDPAAAPVVDLGSTKPLPANGTLPAAADPLDQALADGPRARALREQLFAAVSLRRFGKHRGAAGRDEHVAGDA